MFFCMDEQKMAKIGKNRQIFYLCLAERDIGLNSGDGIEDCVLAKSGRNGEVQPSPNNGLDARTLV